MSFESHDNGPEKSTPEKAQDYLKELEKGKVLQLSSVMPSLKDNGSFVGRVNFITQNPSFVAKFNKNKPEGMPPLSTTKDAYGYKGTQEQNAAYIRTYLEMKAAGTEKPVAAKEVAAADPDKDQNMPVDNTEELDAYLAFLPKKETVNVEPISDVEIRTYRKDPLPNEAKTVARESGQAVTDEVLVINDKKPVLVDVKSGALAEVLASDAPNERAATLVKALTGESGDLKYLFDAWPMAVSAASTTIQEGLQGQGLNPYDTLANTVSAGIKGGDVVLSLKSGKIVTTALLPDSAWHPVDNRVGAYDTPAEAAARRAQQTKEFYASVESSIKADIPDASYFNDTEEFEFDAPAPAIADAKKVNPEDKKGS